MGNALPLWGLIVLLLAAAGWIAPGFLAVPNLLNLLRQAAPLGIICIGQTLTILTGGVDLSVGSVAILSNVIAANIMQGSDAAAKIDAAVEADIEELGSATRSTDEVGRDILARM